MSIRETLNTLQARIAVGTGMLVLGLVVVSLIGVGALRTLGDDLAVQLEALTQVSEESNRLAITLFDQMRAAEQYLTDRSREASSTFEAAGEAAYDLQQRVQGVTDLPTADYTLLTRIGTLQAEAEVLYSLAHAQQDLGRRTEALFAAATAREQVTELISLIEQFAANQSARGDATARSLERTASDRELLVWTVLVASALAGIAIGAATLGSVERPLVRLAAAARRFGDGDLRPVTLGGMPRELMDLGQAMDRLGGTLRNLVGEVI
ncbi:MAG: hypothetical protein ACYSTY_14745, partial [Planctomycetota bacterium]